MNASREARFAVVQVNKIHECTLGKIKCRYEISHIAENIGYISLFGRWVIEKC